MKLTIAHSKTKRRIDGTFHILGSREDLALLVETLVDALSDLSWSDRWVTICHDPPLVGTPPVKWDAP